MGGDKEKGPLPKQKTRVDTVIRGDGVFCKSSSLTLRAQRETDVLICGVLVFMFHIFQQ